MYIQLKSKYIKPVTEGLNQNLVIFECVISIF